jgi:hypothetical protein
LERTAQRIGVAAVLLVVFVGVGCGSSDSGGGSSATVTQTVTTDSAAGEESDGGASDTNDGGNDAGDSGTGSGGDITVPDVVGKDHQLAQDTMQSVGLYNLSEEDATGQGRMLLYDRNWVVVEQDPPAGTEVSEDQTITLRSKKKTDP